MNNIPEIKTKEKSLADLMSRVLKEPLNPIELSVNKLGCDFLELKDKVDEVEQALEVSAASLDKLGKALKKITQEQLPDLSQKIQEDIEGCLRKEIKNLTDTIYVTRKHLTDQLDLQNDKFAEIVRTQQDIKLLFDNLEQSITAKNASLIDKTTGNLSNTMQANREHAEVLITGLSNNANTQYEEIVRKLDDLSTQNQDDANKFLVTLNGVVNNQSTISERISVENSALALAIAASEKKLNSVLMMLLVLAGLVVMYIGYDIFLSK